MKPKNQKQLVLYYLAIWEQVTMKNVILDSMFYKFNTRLSEIENELMTNITTKKVVTFTNKLGNPAHYTVYKRCISLKRIAELFKKFA